MIAVMQPTYLPWIGYFSMISMVSDFIFLNDVQFSRGTWQQRNKVLCNGQQQWLTLPVVRENGLNTLINQVKIFEPIKQKSLHFKVLEQAYKKAKYGDQMLNMLKPIYLDESLVHLDDFNRAIILKISSELKLQPNFHKSSDLNLDGSRSIYLSRLIKSFGSNSYLSPLGAKEYIEEDGILANEQIQVKYFLGHSHPYPQHGSKSFIEYLSIVDLLANLGVDEARKYVLEFAGVMEDF